MISKNQAFASLSEPELRALEICFGYKTGLKIKLMKLLEIIQI